MRNILLVVGATGLLGLFSACGGDDKPPVAVDGVSGKSTGGKSTTGGGGEGGDDGTTTPRGGKGGTAGKGGSGGKPMGLAGEGGGAGGDDSLGPDPLAPTVIITSPTELTDPNKHGVLTGSDVTVLCSATQSSASGSSNVNASAVKIAILNEADEVIEEKPGIPTANPNEFSSKFSLTPVPSGPVSFTCKAEDTSKRSASDSVATFLDKGPIITIVKPAAGSAHALSKPLDIEFTVEAAPLSDTDANAVVDFDSVKLEIVGQAVDLSAASDAPGHYRLQVNLADPKLFNPAPTGPVPLLIEAANHRTPTAVQASLTEDILVDGVGPAIKIVGPLDKAVVGGKVKLTFEVTDAVSGVDPNSIVVALNMDDHLYEATGDAWTVIGNAYTFEFDSRQVENARVQITVNVGATDKVGNVSTGASELLYLDNYPPSVDLDPLNIRTILASNKCSNSFDPVGNAAKNDLDQVARAGIFRAVVVDNTNYDSEVPIRHFSGTDTNSVRLYLQADTTKPLLVDKDMDGFCDDVAEVDSTDSLALATIPKLGAPWYQTDAAAQPAAAQLACTLPLEAAANPPQLLCTANASDMWQVIQDEVNNLPIIYAASPTPNSQECTGVSWEFGGKVDADGWVCFATRAVDNAGNVGISRPIRICVDAPDRAGIPACANSSVDPPTCTDGCTTPARWGGGSWLWK